MESIANLVSRWVIKSTVEIRYTVDSWLYREDPKAISVLQTLRERTVGKPCLVVGNGPSLNATPLDEFTHVPAIGMNKIDLIYAHVRWRPSIVVCVNNLVVRQNRTVYRRSEIPVFLAWKSRWFMGQRGPAVHYFKSLPTADFSTDATRWIGGLSPTVTYSALQFAYYLGADPVILLGVDHRFDSPPGKLGIEKRDGPDLNHFSPSYFRAGQYWGLPDLEGSEHSYRLAKEAFERDGRRILDATIGGCLEVFPKVSMDDVRQIVQSSYS